MYRFLRTPKWIAGHVLALTAVVVFVACGFWQLDRLQHVRADNALQTARLAEAPAPLAEVLAEAGGDPEALAYRRVTVTGSYDVAEEVLLSTRPYQGNPGHRLLTPLVPASGGQAVVVDRGWVPLDLDQPPVREAAPAEPGTTVTVSGILLAPEESSGFGPRTQEGEVDYLGHVDVGRLQQQVDEPLVPAYVLAQTQDPAPPGQLPVPGELPVQDEGPHLNYAGQWFLFATVVLVGYPLLLQRTARERREAAGAGIPRSGERGSYDEVVSGTGGP